MTKGTLFWFVTQLDALTLPHISTDVVLGLPFHLEDGSGVGFKHARNSMNYKRQQTS
jgi:hypothetical protein